MRASVTRMVTAVAFFLFIVASQGIMAQSNWTGSAGSDWGNPNNWSTGFVPGSGDAVIISGTNQPFPVIGSMQASCYSLTLLPGSELSVDGILQVYGIALIDGALNTGAAGNLSFYDDVFWQGNSTVNIIDGSTFHVFKDWTFEAGSHALMQDGTVYFEGYEDATVTSHSDYSCFPGFYVNKTLPATVNVSDASTNDLDIRGDLFCMLGQTLNVNSDKAFRLYGKVACDSGLVRFNDGILVFLGDPFFNFVPATGSYFHNVMVDIDDHTLNIVNSNMDTMHVQGSWTVSSGNVQLNYLPMCLGLNFVDLNDATIFNNSPLIFNGDYPEQVITGGYFPHLIVNKPLDGIVGVLNEDVIIQQYECIAGGIEAGNADVLIDAINPEGLVGKFSVQTGNMQINVYGNSADLLGDVYIYTGTMNIVGQGITATWPAAANCSLTLLDGILKFSGISLDLAPAAPADFECFIGTGKIQLNADLMGMNPDFHPENGAIEFLEGGASHITSVDGFAFNDLIINKCDIDTVYGLNDMLVNGDFHLDAGTISAPDTLRLRGDWSQPAPYYAFANNGGVVIFFGTESSSIWTRAFLGDMIVNKSNADTARLFVENDAVLATNDLDIVHGSLRMKMNTKLTIYGDLHIYLMAGLQSYSKFDNEMELTGDFINNNFLPPTNYIGFKPCKDVKFWGLYGQDFHTNYSGETFNNLRLAKEDSQFNVYDDITIEGKLDFISGIWVNQEPDLTVYFSGDVAISENATWNGIMNPGEVVFAGSGDQGVWFNGSGFFPKVTVDKFIPEQHVPGENQIVSLKTDLTCPVGYVNIANGHLDLNGWTLTAGGGMHLNTTACTLEIDTGAVLRLGSNGLVIDMGSLIMTGEDDAPATITHFLSNYYPLVVNSGFVSADHALMEYMNTAGVVLEENTYLHPEYCFSNSLFREGQAGGTLLHLTDQTMVCSGIHFPENTWGSVHNVYKSMDQGLVSFTGFTGAFSGPVFENDPYDRVNWVTGLQVSGQVTYLNASDVPLSQVILGLYSNNTLIDTAVTDALGNYTFSNVPPGVYSTGVLSLTPWGGVNATDALLILKHFVGFNLLSGLLFEAADVDNTGYVNTVDALIVAKRSVGLITGFPAGNWAFNNPVVLPVGITDVTMNIKGICYGDVNMSYLPPYRLSAAVSLAGEGCLPAAGVITKIPLMMKEAARVAAISLFLEYPSDLIRINNVTIPGSSTPVIYFCQDGILGISWFDLDGVLVEEGNVLVNLDIENLTSWQTLELKVRPNSELADPEGNVFETAELVYPSQRLAWSQDEPAVVYPNPATDRCHLVFYLTESSTVSISLVSTSGQILPVTVPSMLSGGYQDLVIGRNDLAPGLYLVRISIGNSSGIKTLTTRVMFR